MIAMIGRRCFRHRWLVASFWLVVVVAGIFAAGPVFAALTVDNSPRNIESIDGRDVMDAGTDSDGQVIGVVSDVDTQLTGCATRS